MKCYHNNNNIIDDADLTYSVTSIALSASVVTGVDAVAATGVSSAATLTPAAVSETVVDDDSVDGNGNAADAIESVVGGEGVDGIDVIATFTAGAGSSFTDTTTLADADADDAAAAAASNGDVPTDGAATMDTGANDTGVTEVGG